jgi:hypothetical protein
MNSSLFVAIGAIENRYFVFFIIHVVDQVRQAILSYLFTQLIILFIIVVEELAVDFDLVVW